MAMLLTKSNISIRNISVNILIFFVKSSKNIHYFNYIFIFLLTDISCDILSNMFGGKNF